MPSKFRVSYDAQFQAGIDDMILELQRWREAVDAEIRGSVQVWVYDPKLTSIIPLEPEQTQLSFQRMHHSYAMILFNMLVIILSQYHAVVSAPPGTPDIVAGLPKLRADLLTKLDLPLENPLQRAAIAADEMARMIAWIMQDRHKCAGALYIASPAVIADQFWQRFSQSKSVWFATVVSQVNSLWDSYVVCNPDRAGELQGVLM
ncbi:hypothetical protein Slin14017_G044410 [Septoria linicola]|nr:hypothetical protein Slin14017_G044410 [Septoria linicola]